eukprot:1871243-Prymnesium_polylepis.2
MTHINLQEVSRVRPERLQQRGVEHQALVRVVCANLLAPIVLGEPRAEVRGECGLRRRLHGLSAAGCADHARVAVRPPEAAHPQHRVASLLRTGSQPRDLRERERVMARAVAAVTLGG